MVQVPSIKGTCQWYVVVASDPVTLVVPKPKCTILSNGAFVVAGSTEWNALPGHLRSLNNLSTFKTNLKAYCFTLAEVTPFVTFVQLFRIIFIYTTLYKIIMILVS